MKRVRERGGRRIGTGEGGEEEKEREKSQGEAEEEGREGEKEEEREEKAIGGCSAEGCWQKAGSPFLLCC